MYDRPAEQPLTAAVRADVLIEATAELHGKMTPREAAVWWKRPNRDLDGSTPCEALENGWTEPVIRAAVLSTRGDVR
jgi:hypothetical protein